MTCVCELDARFEALLGLRRGTGQADGTSASAVASATFPSPGRGPIACVEDGIEAAVTLQNVEDRLGSELASKLVRELMNPLYLDSGREFWLKTPGTELRFYLRSESALRDELKARTTPLR